MPLLAPAWPSCKWLSSVISSRSGENSASSRDRICSTRSAVTLVSEGLIRFAFAHQLVGAFALFLSAGFCGYPDRLDHDHGEGQPEHPE